MVVCAFSAGGDIRLVGDLATVGTKGIVYHSDSLCFSVLVADNCIHGQTNCNNLTSAVGVVSGSIDHFEGNGRLHDIWDAVSIFIETVDRMYAHMLIRASHFMYGGRSSIVC